MWEHNILLFIQEHLRTPWLTQVMKGASFLGEAGWFFILIALLLLWKPKTRRYGICMCAALLLELLMVNGILKPLAARVRPYDRYPDLILLGKAAGDYSFPSGHSGAAAAAAAALWFGLPRGKKLPGALLLCVAAVVSFSRLYVGIHYPTDVLAGILIGIVCGFLAVRIPYDRLPLPGRKK